MSHKRTRPERPLVHAFQDFSTMPEETLFHLWVYWYPGGSGPLVAMKTICSLIETVATLRGFDTSKWPERKVT